MRHIVLPVLLTMTVCAVRGSAATTFTVELAATSGTTVGPGGSILDWGYSYDGRCNVPPPNESFVALAGRVAHGHRKSDCRASQTTRSVHGRESGHSCPTGPEYNTVRADQGFAERSHFA